MSKKRGVIPSRGDSIQGLYKLREDLSKLGDVPNGNEFYDYVVKFLEVVAKFEDEYFVQSFRAPVINSLQTRNFRKSKNIFMSYLDFFGRGGKINHTNWREEIKLENVYLLYVDNGKDTIKTAYEWKNSEKKHKEKYTQKIRLHLMAKMGELVKSLNGFIKSFE